MNDLVIPAPLRARWFQCGMFAGLACWLAIFKVAPPQNYSWALYGRALLLYTAVMLPALAFAWYRPRLQHLSPLRYRLLWLLCFAVLLPALATGAALLRPEGFYTGDFLTCAMLAITLELVLMASEYHRRLVREGQWLGKISLEKAALATIVLICLALALMATSSLHDPAYHKADQLLIGFEFRPGRIMQHFGFFLGFFLQLLFIYGCGYLFFFLNNRLLVAKVLKEMGIAAYLLGVFAVVALLYPVIAQLLAWLPANAMMGQLFAENPFKFENAFSALLIIFISLPLVLAMQWGRQNNRIVHLEKEKTEAELVLLRQQLNPHFFFNTLNNLYAMSLQQSRQTPESILQLSELMRYVIYKGQETAVPLQEEVKYVEDYIRLQTIRLKEKPDYSFSVDISPDAPRVAPLLLIVFVENAFKHGIAPAENKGWLHLQLRSTRTQLHFRCENSVEDVSPGGQGIGLANLQKRLALLYPDRHHVGTGLKNHTFKAEMQITFS